MYLDSLADMVTFGVAPGMFVLVSYLDYGWLDVFPHSYFFLLFFSSIIYICAGAYRLARFHTLQANTSTTANTHYIGMPITLNGVLFPLSLAILTFVSGNNHLVFLSCMSIYMLVSAYLMASTIRFPKYMLSLLTQSFDTRILAEHDVSSKILADGRKVYIKIPKKLTFFHWYNKSYRRIACANHLYIHRHLSPYCTIPQTHIHHKKWNSYRIVQDAVHDARPVVYADLQDPDIYTKIESMLTQWLYMRDRDGCFPDLCGSDALYDFALHNILIDDNKELFFIDTVWILKKYDAHPIFCLLCRILVPAQVAIVRQHLLLGKMLGEVKRLF
jgi:hypothetical protein